MYKMNHCRRTVPSMLRHLIFKRYQSSDVIRVSEEVQNALHYGKPLVALETTIVTHGMPHPQNFETAIAVENVVRDCGAVPATIGILQGKVKVGLSSEELEFLSNPNTSSVKTSRRDLPAVLSKNLNGGTTVSGTMVVANLVGIQIFITGGIGGVHHGVQDTMDISADLTELGRTPVTVVSSGIKSILDIGRTLEYLETEGVCVATYGSSKEFPAFFSPHSGFHVPYNLTNPSQAAHFIDSKRKLKLQSGMLIGVPIPESKSGEVIQKAIQSAVIQAKEKGVSGKEVTPYILKTVNDMTDGASLDANISLIKNNALVGSQIAVKLSKLQKSHKSHGDRVVMVPSKQHTKPEVVVVGGSIVDFYARVDSDYFQSNGATYPGGVDQSFGGVGRNLADALTRLGIKTFFISAVGKDSHLSGFKAYCSHMNMKGVLELEDSRTATYCAVLKKGGELLFGIGDMDIHSKISTSQVDKFYDLISEAKLVCIDGNLTVETIRHICKLAHSKDIPVWFEPTDIHKASKPFQFPMEHNISMASPNLNEMRAMYKFLTGSMESGESLAGAESLTFDDVLRECIILAKVVVMAIPFLLLTLGKHGVVLCRRYASQKPEKGIMLKDGSYMTMDWYPATRKGFNEDSIRSVSGAGDCLAATVVSGKVRSHDLDQSIKKGLLAAQLSLCSNHAVPPTFSESQLTLSPEVEKELTGIRIASPHS